MDDPLHVAICNALQDLVKELLHFAGLDHGMLAEGLHVALKVFFEVFEHKIQLLLVDDHVLQPA